MGLPSRYRLEFDHISLSLFLGGETILYSGERHNVYGEIDKFLCCRDSIGVDAGDR